MNILVTVGTTAFDDLIENIDRLFGNDTEVKIVAQTSSSAKYTPKNIDYFEFSDSFQSYIDSADLVITHAGAGSVYSMLEMGKRLIVVPNLTRADNHQIELAKYVQDSSFAISCFDLTDIKTCIHKAKDMNFRPYQCDKFFGHCIIRGLMK